MSYEPEGLPEFADRLNTLFAHVPRRDGGQLYTNDTATEELRGRGISVTVGYLRQLRAGSRRNPTTRLLAAIAQLFDVPIVFFFDDDVAGRITAQLENVTRLREAGVRSVMARSGGLTARDLAELGPILEDMRRLGEQGSTDAPDEGSNNTQRRP